MVVTIQLTAPPRQQKSKFAYENLFEFSSDLSPFKNLKN
jgi:hypothetical protein